VVGGGFAGMAAAVAVPRFSGPPPMTGPFNVAVVQFGQIDEMGNIVAWEQGPSLAEATFLSLTSKFDSLTDMKNLVQIRNYPTEAVSGRTPAERAQSAQLLAERLQAHLVVYGIFQRDREQSAFSPEFYASELTGAEELLGRHQLGAPVTAGRSRSGLGQALASAEIAEALRARTEVFSLLAVGLGYLMAGRPPTAAEYFEKAERMEGWQDSVGRDVLYLLLGSVYRARAEDGDRGRAFAAYQTALRLNAESARAYLGLGYLHYEEFLGSGCTDDAALDQALLQYQNAASARLRPGSDYMEARIRLELGNAYLVKAQLGRSDLFASARTELQWVIDAYERGNQRLEPVASYAYAGMGVIQERHIQDLGRAADLYQRALGTAGENDEIRELAEVQKDTVQPLRPTGRNDGRRDAGAVGPAPTVKPARHCRALGARRGSRNGRI